MKTLTKEQVETLLAFIDAVEQRTDGMWPQIEEHMQENWGIGDPETALEEVAEELRKR